MSEYSYAAILKAAKICTTNVSKEYKLGVTTKWGYYFAKSILNPKKNIKKISFNTASKPVGTKISRQVKKTEYTDMAKRFVTYVEKHKQLPNYISLGNHQVRTRVYVLMFAKILVSYSKNNKFPDEVNVNYKAFTKPVETTDEIYTLFVKTFGKITCIDDALEKIAGRGYGYYYDDHKTNKETITGIKSSSHSDDPNCTDSTQMMKHVADGTGKYKRVDCVHVRCQGGDGHVYLKITQKDGSVFYRDPAAVLDSGIVNKVWCGNGTILAINPNWWLANLNR